MKNLAIERLRAALDEEYPPGQVTITAHDARTLLELVDADPESAPAASPHDPSAAAAAIGELVSELRAAGFQHAGALEYLEGRVFELAQPEKPIQD